jgi:hypothetical protein
MSLSMYHASVTVMTNTLTNLIGILEKGAAYAEAKKIDPVVLVTSRLYPDMFPLARQVQIASDQAKGSVARLAGQEPPKFDDNEASFPELIARVQKTIAFLKTFTPAQIDGSEQRAINITQRGKPVTYQGMPYLLHHALPNVFFHVSTAYNILRHNGVDVGKADFIGKVQ